MLILSGYDFFFTFSLSNFNLYYNFTAKNIVYINYVYQIYTETDNLKFINVSIIKSKNEKITHSQNQYHPNENNTNHQI